MSGINVITRQLVIFKMQLFIKAERVYCNLMAQFIVCYSLFNSSYVDALMHQFDLYVMILFVLLDISFYFESLHFMILMYF